MGVQNSLRDLGRYSWGLQLHLGINRLLLWRRNAQLLAKRAQGQILGKPKGTLHKSKFDQNLEKIKELLGYGLSVRKIARVLGYTSHIALNTYINKRGLHQTVEA